MNLTFFRGSYRLAASMRPMFPSLMRSRKESPHPRYRLAYETTKRRLASTSFCTAALSPLRIRSPSLRSSSTVIRGSFAISFRYFFSDSEDWVRRGSLSSSIGLLDGGALYSTRRGELFATRGLRREVCATPGAEQSARGALIVPSDSGAGF